MRQQPPVLSCLISFCYSHLNPLEIHPDNLAEVRKVLILCLAFGAMFVCLLL